MMPSTLDSDPLFLLQTIQSQQSLPSLDNESVCGAMATALRPDLSFTSEGELHARPVRHALSLLSEDNDAPVQIGRRWSVDSQGLSNFPLFAGAGLPNEAFFSAVVAASAPTQVTRSDSLERDLFDRNAIAPATTSASRDRVISQASTPPERQDAEFVDAESDDEDLPVPEESDSEDNSPVPEPDATAPAHSILSKRRSRGGHEYPTPTDLAVCTIMCIADIGPKDGSGIDLDLQKFAHGCEVDPRRQGLLGLCYRNIVKGNIRVPKKAFGDQVQLHVRVGDNKNIIVKAFHTGKLHLTGCRDMASASQTVQIIVKAIADVCRKAADAVTTGGVPAAHLLRSTPDTISVVNANCTYCCGLGADQRFILAEVQKLFSQPQYSNRVLRAEYNTELQGKRGWYPGVKVYMKRDDQLAHTATKPLFVGVFSSGKVILSGAHGLQEANDAYHFISHTLHNAYERIRGTEADNRKPVEQEVQDSAAKRRRR